jgi:hypothetical protein
MRKLIMLLAMTAVIGFAGACTRHRIEVAPVEVKPIHITIDVNVKIDREIDNYFGDLFEKEEQIREQQATQAPK